MQCRSENPGFPEFSMDFCDFQLEGRFLLPFRSQGLTQRFFVFAIPPANLRRSGSHPGLPDTI